MYLKKLHLRDIKILADQVFSFETEAGQPRLWTVLIGNNGLCKTTVLQAIALAAVGEKQAVGLVDDAESFKNSNHRDHIARIEATFQTTGNGGPPEQTVALEVPEGWHEFVGVAGSQWIAEIRGQRKPGYFVAGYGAGRVLPKPGEVAIPRDPVLDRVRGLFDARHKMLGIDFFGALRERGLQKEFVSCLRDVLMAEDPTGQRLLPGLERIGTKGQGGIKTLDSWLEERRFHFSVDGEIHRLHPHSLSHGYQSTIAWITDLLGHAFLDAGAVDPQTLEGIVLIDEIDLHLHPTWQRNLVPTLKRVFPKLQFVVTTHSPLVLPSFAAEEIIRLELEDGEVVQKRFETEPGLLDAVELLTDYFEVRHAARPELLMKKRRLAELLGHSKRNRQENQELEALRRELEPYLDAGGEEAT